jgi:hypothetical protein
MQTVIEMTSDAPLPLPIPLPLLFTQQKMLLIAAGDVIAGFDLTKIAPVTSWCKAQRFKWFCRLPRYW